MADVGDVQQTIAVAVLGALNKKSELTRTLILMVKQARYGDILPRR